MKLHLLTVGTFAAAVAENCTTALHEHTVLAFDATETPHASPAFWPQVDLRVLITGRPSPYLERVLDQSVIDSGVPAVAITIEHPRLRLDPLLGTGGACMSCMRARRAQHDPSHARVQPLIAAYDADPTLEPAGHLPHHVRFATSWLRSVVEQLSSGSTEQNASQVRSINLHTGTLSVDRIVRLHGCPRCRKSQPLAESSWLQMAADLTTESPELLKSRFNETTTLQGTGAVNHV